MASGDIVRLGEFDITKYSYIGYATGNSVNTVYTDVITLNGEGLIRGAYTRATSTTGNVRIKIFIDEVLMFEGESNYSSGYYPTGIMSSEYIDLSSEGTWLIESNNLPYTTIHSPGSAVDRLMMPILFKSSVRIQAYNLSADKIIPVHLYYFAKPA